MEKYRAILQGYMTVGELAKKLGTTVRTLQYYDKEGLLKPSAESDGGRRLYTDKDTVRLHMILSLKSLGFSLEAIKGKLMSLETPDDVAKALSEQASSIKSQIDSLSDTLADIEALREEVLQMQTVDFTKYAGIITNLQMKNDHYRLIKYLDDKTLEHCRTAFDLKSAEEIIDTYKRLSERAIEYRIAGVEPSGEKGMRFAEEFWNMIERFTDGDMTMLPKLLEVETLAQEHESTFDGEKRAQASKFIGEALDAYFGKLGIDPFGIMGERK